MNKKDGYRDQKPVNELEYGEFFILHPLKDGKRTPAESSVYIRKEYDRSERAYWCQKFSDISDGKYLKGEKIVYTDFEF